MTDISKCHGVNCAKKENCYRYTCKASDHQSWTSFCLHPKPCKGYMPLTSGPEKNKKMTNKQQFIKDMEALQKAHTQYIVAVDDLYKIGFGIEAPILSVTDEFFNLTIRLIADKYGIDDGAIKWFIFDDDWGSKGFECSHGDGGPEYKITDLDDFWEFEKNDRT